MIKCCRDEGNAQKDHSEFLAQEIFNKRPEQLSVTEFIALTKAVEEETKA